MTDEELGAIRKRNIYAEGVRAARRDRAVLLVEVDRLRAERDRFCASTPKHSEEGWLADVRQYLRDGYAIHPDTIRLLVDWIDATDSLLFDMQQDAGAMLAMEQGAAEERARIVAEVRRYGGMADRSSGFLNAESLAEAIEGTPTPDLLPPAAARLAVAEERRKVETLRRALELVRANYFPESVAGKIARETLAATEGDR